MGQANTGQAKVRDQVRVRQVEDGRQNGQNREKLGNRTKETGRRE